jgi:hypothetical protein
MEDVAAASSALLAQLSRLVKGLKAEEVQAILAGDTKIVLVPKGSTVVRPLVLADVADEVRRASTVDQVVSLLDPDKRLTAAKLRQLADELNITVPASAKSKPAIVLYIAQTVIDHRRRTHGGS